LNREIHKKRHPFSISLFRKNNVFLHLEVVKIFKLMGMYGDPMPINLTEQVASKTIKMNFIAIKDSNFSFWGHYKILT
ncbi:hypothetical protein, partial [Bacillus mycoides]|uniref:hypothetical protein n=1 Tax=Bacillus mycoides TaxID=1405 RepID=UPI003D24A426